jgi:hypothetical protein
MTQLMCEGTCAGSTEHVFEAEHVGTLCKPHFIDGTRRLAEMQQLKSREQVGPWATEELWKCAICGTSRRWGLR